MTRLLIALVALLAVPPAVILWAVLEAPPEPFNDGMHD